MKRLTSRLNTIDWYLAAALLLAWAAALPLLEPDALLNTRGGGDSPFLLQRTHQLLAALRLGQFPVRWMPDAYYGYGYPFFNFYAPLSIYISALFKLLGFPFTRAIQLAQLAGFLLAAWGMYALMLRISARRTAALLASVAFTFAPFHMVNVYVRGDSLAEFWAMAFYPLTLLSAETLITAATRRDRTRSVLMLAVTFACLVLSHNISALIFSPFLLLFCLLRLFSTRDAWKDRDGVVGRFIFLVLAGLLGAGLSVWFWLPALGEQALVQLAPVTEGFFNYAGHFLGWDMVQGSLAFSYDVLAAQTPFRMGLVQAALVLVALLVVVFRWRSISAETRPYILFALFTLLISTFMITPLSRVIWDNLPLLEFTQFPWRFLSVQALAAALLIGSGVAQLPASDSADETVERLLIGVLIAVISWSALSNLHPDFIHLTDADVTAEKLIEYEWFSGNVGTTISAEYLPIGVQPRAWSDGDPIAGLLPALWWPGTMLDGEKAEAAVGSGLVLGTSGQVQQGRSSPARRAESISLAVLLLVIVVATRVGRWSDKWPLAVFGVMLLLVVVGQLERSGQPVWASSALDTRSWDFGQQAYLHHAPDGIVFDNGVVLEGYDISAELKNSTYHITIDLHWMGDGGEWMLDLATPALYRATESQPVPVYVSQTMPLQKGLQRVEFVVSAETLPPTRLLPRLRLEGASALTSNQLTRGDLFLAPITLPNAALPAAAERLQASVTDVVPQPDGDLLVLIQWTTPAPITANYQAAWKLYDRLGRFYAEVDAQPGYGYLPTTTWQPGRVIPEQLLLRWLADDGIAPYTLVATLRDVAADAVVYREQVALLDADGTLLNGRAGRFDTLPTGAMVVSAEFEAKIALQGFQLESYGDSRALVLYWEALDNGLDNYARFVHIIDPTSGAIVAQQDGQPQYNTHPTTAWQRGDLIEDVVALDISALPAGEYEMRVGLYPLNPEDGGRLELTATTLPHSDNALLIPMPLAVSP